MIIKLKDILFESPHQISVHNVKLNLTDTMIAFAYRTGVVYLGNYNSTHEHLGEEDSQFKHDFKEYKHRGSIDGRIWPHARVISFWKAPTPVQMKKFIADMNIGLKRRGYKSDVKFDDSWYMDVDKESKDVNGNAIVNEDLITLKDYINKDFLADKIYPSFYVDTDYVQSNKKK